LEAIKPMAKVLNQLFDFDAELYTDANGHVHWTGVFYRKTLQLPSGYNMTAPWQWVCMTKQIGKPSSRGGGYEDLDVDLS
jgi:hypothetical protein